jgi:hypothetical protein
MNCQKFENVVSELARGQMMAAQQRGEALAHSDACEECAARLYDEEMLTRGLQSLAAEMEPLLAPGNVESNLLEAFRARQVVVPISSRRSSSRYWLAAVAAILLIVMSVIAVRWRSSGVVAPQQIAEEKTLPDKAKALDEPSNETPKEVEYRVDNVPHRRLNRKPNRPARLPGSENAQLANHVNEIATDFIPLRYLNPASLQDGGQIVRVELPRSALANFGLPVNMDRYNEKVKADVLLGVDGLAHAIRFVQ